MQQVTFRELLYLGSAKVLDTAAHYCHYCSKAFSRASGIRTNGANINEMLYAQHILSQLRFTCDRNMGDPG